MSATDVMTRMTPGIFFACRASRGNRRANRRGSGITSESTAETDLMTLRHEKKLLDQIGDAGVKPSHKTERWRFEAHQPVAIGTRRGEI